MHSEKTLISSKALRRFIKNTSGVLSLGFIILCFITALFAYFLATDSSSNANQMHLEIHSKKPGFKALVLTFPQELPNKQSYFNYLLNGNQNPPNEIIINSYNLKNNLFYYLPYYEGNLKPEEISLPISTFKNSPIENQIKTKTYWFGTDKYGRDLYSRMLIGSRITFFVGFIAVFISLIIGITLGSIAGYFGGKTDAFIQWLINVTWSIPTLLLVIAITLALGKGFWQVFIAVGLTMWVEVARVVRGQVLSIKKMQYIEAAKVLGFSDMRIIFKHILPNIMAPIIVISAANFASAILIESGLSFLGIGAQPPIPSWGAMIKENYNYIILGKPYLAMIPGIAIMSLVLAFMLIGNALRDALDVKT
jgi:peptide/nickel transport system permease protein